MKQWRGSSHDGGPGQDFGTGLLVLVEQHVKIAADHEGLPVVDGSLTPRRVSTTARRAVSGAIASTRSVRFVRAGRRLGCRLRT